MRRSVDVEEIAQDILNEIGERYLEEIEAAIALMDDGNNGEMNAVLLYGIVSSLKCHTERFAIRLVQKVVDELERTKGI
ncbi:hypothetical protein [Heliophilum fasciatum]|uniref:Uncharacterized protein n=1 Tax=Heliophilum fasciatum TaxID=35700 RepID=A0A4R2RZQ1_9FIRM|nr:hypothetical protein [Heliophilum fasciatum]MCW2277097.1 hypothetical protein [Heliophilum fasciatum]TCP68377.1 hypothetical protein EDD73_1036 [Heliophilum fasciatum]